MRGLVVCLALLGLGFAQAGQKWAVLVCGQGVEESSFHSLLEDTNSAVPKQLAQRLRQSAYEEVKRRLFFWRIAAHAKDKTSAFKMTEMYRGKSLSEVQPSPEFSQGTYSEALSSPGARFHQIFPDPHGPSRS